MPDGSFHSAIATAQTRASRSVRQRRLHPTGSVASVITTAPSVTTAAHPDAAILSAYRVFLEVHQRYEGSCRPNSGVSEDDGDRLHTAWHAALDDVTKTQATTPDGWRAKAAVMVAVFEMKLCSSPGDVVEEQAEYHELLAWRLANDILLGSLA